MLRHRDGVQVALQRGVLDRAEVADPRVVDEDVQRAEGLQRALDRALLSGDYVISLFFLPRVWVAYWAQLRLPGVAPLAGVDVDTWWTERTN